MLAIRQLCRQSGSHADNQARQAAMLADSQTEIDDFIKVTPVAITLQSATYH
jgi:hypothetical protein